MGLHFACTCVRILKVISAGRCAESNVSSMPVCVPVCSVGLYCVGEVWYTTCGALHVCVRTYVQLHVYVCMWQSVCAYVCAVWCAVGVGCYCVGGLWCIP